MPEKFVYELQLNIDKEMVDYFRTATDVEEMKAVLAHLISEGAKTVIDNASKRGYDTGFSDGWDSCMEELQSTPFDAAKFMH